MCSESPATYFKRYRQSIGFSNQKDAKGFLAAKNITPGVDFDYIENLNERVKDIIQRINSIASPVYCRDDLEAFTSKYIIRPYQIIQGANLLPRLNNQGRRPEEVLFSWLRGFVVAEFFTPAIARIFDVEIEAIQQIGDDDLRRLETFRRSPKADFAIQKNDKTINLEVQVGFQGVNDIKEHKVREARRVFEEEHIHTIDIHIDLFNGQVAFVQLDTIQENDVNFVTRQQMEGQSVFAIDQNYFKWRLLDEVPSFDELEFEL